MITEELAPASLPAGQRVYAVGDVHGCDDRLADMHDAVAADLAARPVPHALLIHLGDYIDRGPASAAVLDRLTRPLAAAPALPVLNLAGNHEDMLLRALDGSDAEEPNTGCATAAAKRWRAGGYPGATGPRSGRPPSRRHSAACCSAWHRAAGSAATSSSMPGCGRTSR